MQKKLGIDDDGLVEALGEGPNPRLKALLASSYAIPLEPVPTPTPAAAIATTPPLAAPPPGEYITLLRDVEIPRGASKEVIPKGSKLLVVSRGADVVQVRAGNNGSEIIPSSAVADSK